MEIAHARAAEVKSNGNSTTKRRKLDAGELVKSSSLDQCSCLINSTSPTRISVSSDQTPANLICSDELCDCCSRSAHLQVENLKENNSTFMNSCSREITKSKGSSAQQASMAEIEEFFSVAEKNEAKRFAEKYNYDFVNDVPLQGKYQWVRIKH